MGAWSKLAFGDNEYLGQMDIWGNGYLGKIYIRGIRHREKWALVQIGTKANGHLGKSGIPNALKRYSKYPLPIFPKCLQMGAGANGHLGKMDIWGKRVPQVS